MGMMSNTARIAALAILFGAMAWAVVREGVQASIPSGDAAQVEAVVPDSAELLIPDTLEVLVMLPFGLEVDTLPGGFLPRKTKGFARSRWRVCTASNVPQKRWRFTEFPSP